MDHQSSDIEFALIGHQDSWKKITSFVDYLSINKQPLTAEKIAEVYSFIPPRKLFDIEVHSITGQTSKGCYIESFISPAELGLRHWKKNLQKVKEAANCARRTGARIAGLGGFTSIVLEGRDHSLNENSITMFTTGNTLTAAFIVKAIEKACRWINKDIKEQKVLVIGATGDIGSACVRYFAGKVNELLLCARQATALEMLKEDLSNNGCTSKASTDLTSLLPEADIIIAIASSTIEDFHSALCKEDVIICDGGYPKNLVVNFDAFSARLFCGGMGTVTGGFHFTPAIHHSLYDFPVPNTGHACLLEAVILAFEENHIPYSTGKGKITIEKMEWIYAAAQKHGITEAPFFNPLNVWSKEQTNEKTNQWTGTLVEPDLYS
jgi:predicted amino acid dehydrogenase